MEAKALLRAWDRGLTPNPDLTVSEWVFPRLDRTERMTICGSACLFLPPDVCERGVHANVSLRPVVSGPVVCFIGCTRLDRMQIGMGRVMQATDGFRRATGPTRGCNLPLTDTGRMSHEPDPCLAAAQHRIVRNRSVKSGHLDQAFCQFSRLPQKKSAQHFQRLEVLISKRAIEDILRDFDAVHGLKSVLFRYDCVHVSGLVDAHVPGLKWLESGKGRQDAAGRGPALTRCLRPDK